MRDLLVFATLFLIVGIIGARKSIAQWLRARRAQTWPTVPGSIEKPHVKISTTEYGSFYTIEVGYGYEYQGEFYPGYFQGGTTSSEEQADALVHAFPPGGSVMVKVNPEKPEESVLA